MGLQSDPIDPTKTRLMLTIGTFLSGQSDRIVISDRDLVQLADPVFFRHWITIGFESDHDPELSTVISLGGRISANRDVTKVNKNKFR